MSSQTAANGYVSLLYTDDVIGTDGYPEAIGVGRTDVFLRKDANLGGTNIILGPYFSKASNYFGYWNYGRFATNVLGRWDGEFGALFPHASSGVYKSGLGLNNIQTNYKNAYFFVMDDDTDRYFRLMQGVNVHGGGIWSNRATVLGGALVGSNNISLTTDNVNSGIDGYLEAGEAAGYESNMVRGTVKMSMLIENADIVLYSDTPDAGMKDSVIRRPDTWRDQRGHECDAKVEPRMDIRGGTIFVGEGQRLTIQGTTVDNMLISPDKIVVEDGGELVIEASSFVNITTSIYAKEGSALTIKEGAKIQGDIYADGQVEILGSFLLNAPVTLNDDPATTVNEASSPYLHGLVCSASATLILTNPALTVVSGNSGKIHTLNPYPAYEDAWGAAFCNENYPAAGEGRKDDGMCKHWFSGEYTWRKIDA